MRTLARALEFLAPIASQGKDGEPGDGRPLLNVQVSVDSVRPDRRRLTLDPFVGEHVAAIAKARLIDVLHSVVPEALLNRCVRLHEFGDLPQTLWVGLAPAGDRCGFKVYAAAYLPALRRLLIGRARQAGWLPTRVVPELASLYERLVPSLAAPEGIAISFNGDAWLGTTFYFRSTAPWNLCASPAFCDYLGISPRSCLKRLSRVLGSDPSIFGWSIECDQHGALVDLKLELSVGEGYAHASAAAYAEEFGLSSESLRSLADDIRTTGLSLGDAPPPAVMSLRFVEGSLHGIVGYFPLIGTKPWFSRLSSGQIAGAR